MSTIDDRAPPRANPDLVKLLTQLMDGVTTGKITSIACVTVSPLGQMQWPGCGMQIAEMMIGAELMRDDMKQAMRGAANKILRAG
jgi:hypothetical protein